MSALQVQQAFSLASVSKPEFFKHNSVFIESEKSVTIMDQDANGASQITLVNMLNNNTDRRPNKGEAAIKHPNQNILTLRAKLNASFTLQIWNLDTKQKIVATEFTDAVQYWKWVSNTVFAVVTQTSVYTIDISQPNPSPLKLFSKQGKLSTGAQVSGFAMQAAGNWAALYGIYTPDQGQTINGHIQLYKKGANAQQDLQGHCATFCDLSLNNDGNMNSVIMYFEKKEGAQQANIIFKQVDQQGLNKSAEFPLTSPKDFPIVMYGDSKTGILYCVTKEGNCVCFEISSGMFLTQQKFSNSPIFIGCPATDEGLLVINKEGAVLKIAVNKQALVQSLANNPELSMKLALKFQLPGTETMVIDNFNRALQSGDYKLAAQIAAGSQGTTIRNTETINKIKQIQPQPGQHQPIIVYLLALLEKGQLNAQETTEFALPILQQNKKDYLLNWINQNKFTFTEQFGDLVKNYDAETALTIYKKGNCSGKVVSTMLEMGKPMSEVEQYGGGGNIDYIAMVKQMMATNPDGAVKIAISAYKSNPNINIYQIAELFKNASKLQQMCVFLSETMQQNKDEDGQWQTIVLVFYLQTNPQFAQSILQTNKWTKFDRIKIAQLCEQRSLYQNALSNYNDIKDIKRVLANSQNINNEWLKQYLCKIPGDWSLVCMQDMIRQNKNIQVITEVCTINHQSLGTDNCIKLFESSGQNQALFQFLSAVIQNSQDKTIFFKYIQAAAKSNQIKALIEVIKDRTDFYDPVVVKDFLKEIKLPDPKPFMLLCDIHGFIEEMTKYLYLNTNNFKTQIEFYLFKVNLKTSPIVLGTLIDLECDENYIKQILFNLRGSCPIQEVIEVFEKRNKLKILENWLEQRNAEGNQLPEIHNSLGKIKIETNDDPESFLINNQFYDPKYIGKFCEEWDPHLAVIAYKRTWGTCDQELIEVTNKNNLFRLQARYLVERQDANLWEQVLMENNEHRKDLIEQVISSALPESQSGEEVSSTIQAFLQADIPMQLLDLLEKIILRNSEFSKYPKLQNLLIKTAIKADTSKVINYINRLESYEPEVVGENCIENNLFEEAFTIYSKQDTMKNQAMSVLLNNLKDVKRAHEFAEKANQAELWSMLGNAHLNNYETVEAIECYMKNKDITQYHTLIQMGEGSANYLELTKYLLMCRELTKDMLIDNSLVYCYAQQQKNKEIEQILSNSNSVDQIKVGDRCYEAQLYESAKLLYISAKNNSKLASCLVRLKNYSQAIEAAKLANTSKTWKELCFACVEAGEYRLAAVAGINIIIHADHLESIIRFYEEHCVSEEMIGLLETGIGLDRVHSGIYTELGMLYAKYKPEKLMQYCKNYQFKMNSAKILKNCKKYLHWEEAAYLHEKYEEYDEACSIMIEHSPSAFKHDIFLSCITKVANYEYHFKGLQFYLEENPQIINDYLKVLHNKIDLNRCISQMDKTGYLALIVPFLETIQSINNKDVNEALNRTYIEQEDFEKLRESISQFDNFDSLKLTDMARNHTLLEFRRIAAFLYRKGEKYTESIELSLNDKAYRDVIETSFESQNVEIVEKMLRFFVEKGEKEFFCVCLYTNYELIRSDLVMELAWRADLMGFAMPYFVQVNAELQNQVRVLNKENEDRKKKEENNQKISQEQTMSMATDIMGPANMIAPPTDIYQSAATQQFGQPQGGFMGQSQPPPSNDPFGGFHSANSNPYGGF